MTVFLFALAARIVTEVALEATLVNVDVGDFEGSADVIAMSQH